MRKWLLLLALILLFWARVAFAITTFYNYVPANNATNVFPDQILFEPFVADNTHYTKLVYTGATISVNRVTIWGQRQNNSDGGGCFVGTRVYKGTGDIDTTTLITSSNLIDRDTFPTAAITDVTFSFNTGFTMNFNDTFYFKPYKTGVCPNQVFEGRNAATGYAGQTLCYYGIITDTCLNNNEYRLKLAGDDVVAPGSPKHRTILYY